ncbi:response regulator [Cesiribacter sp. SM1]|uniref:response regulator n=1 Tax=Cesiribacter sp. SM1 TaxID=2861196 RepID=UPI001CD728E6|nr:response regulator [Cesiribacter sp. SM1]
MGTKIKNIIFIDDDEIIGMVSKRLLEHMGLADEVLVFSDSVKAFQFLKARYGQTPQGENNSRDLIFVDIDMPGLGGYEMLYLLRELNKKGHINLSNTNFVVVTSHKTDKEVQLSKGYEVVEVLEKPLRQLDIDNLIRKI